MYKVNYAFSLFAPAALLCVGLIGCQSLQKNDFINRSVAHAPASATLLGPVVSKDKIQFNIFSSAATRVEIYFYKKALGADEVARFELAKNPTDSVWSVDVAWSKLNQLGLGQNIFYGYRLWGPNWEYTSDWVKGSTKGFKAHVDDKGNRFNPNKLILDPYAREISHDPINSQHQDFSYFQTGQDNYQKDSGPFASKGIVLLKNLTDSTTRIRRPLKDEIIYEVHLKGLTANDFSVPTKLRGTYRGAALKAKYLKDLGVTAVEFLPVQETQNDQNSLKESTNGANYWGYMTINYFSPDRRFSSDKSIGGPTAEFRAMTEAFHKVGIKVYVDVVYNHTSEGGVGGDANQADLISYRGIDNSAYYLLTADKKRYWENTGTGNNLNTAHPVARNLIVDSLIYWKNKLGVDGFRFDLAPVLGNSQLENGFRFDKLDPENSLNRLVKELPVRLESGSGDGVDLMAEPWTTSSFNLGEFPSGWAEWNGSYRDKFRKHQNKDGFESITPGQLAQRFAGSADIFQNNGRKPWHSINFIDVHDGFTLADIYRYNSKINFQAWPMGPSDGGSDDNDSWDQDGNYEQQRQAARNALSFLMLSSGVPLIQGGDEFLRTLKGNNNAYNLDSVGNWLDWSQLKNNLSFNGFSKRIMKFRQAHSSLRNANYFDGQDHNGNGLTDITWHTANGSVPDSNYWSNSKQRFLAYRIDASETSGESVQSIFVAYNGQSSDVTVNLPTAYPGKNWYRISDTAAWFESQSNFSDKGDLLSNNNYDMKARSVLILIER